MNYERESSSTFDLKNVTPIRKGHALLWIKYLDVWCV